MDVRVIQSCTPVTTRETRTGMRPRRLSIVCFDEPIPNPGTHFPVHLYWLHDWTSVKPTFFPNSDVAGRPTFDRAVRRCEGSFEGQTSRQRVTNPASSSPACRPASSILMIVFHFAPASAMIEMCVDKCAALCAATALAIAV